jgi:hypothetical protein
MASTSLSVGILGTQILVWSLSASYAVGTFALHRGSDLVLFAFGPQASSAKPIAVVVLDDAFMAALPPVEEFFAHLRCFIALVVKLWT